MPPEKEVKSVLHFADYDDRKISEVIKKDNISVYELYSRLIQGSSGVGMIIHNNQGWGHIDWIREFKRSQDALVANGEEKVKVIFLHRVNYISGYQASSNTVNFKKRTVVAPVKSMNLSDVLIWANERTEQYKAGLAEFSRQDPNVYYATYESLIDNATGFLPIFRFLGINDVSLAQSDPNTLTGPNINITVSSTTKHHTNMTLSYISNIQEVAQELIYQHEKYPGLQVCMLFDACKF